jgi:ribosomal protein S12 methylthiotransferase
MLPMYKERNQQPSKQQTAEQESEENRKLNFRFDGNKINFISLGCPRNLVDSEVMLGILLHAGYEVAFWKLLVKNRWIQYEKR